MFNEKNFLILKDIRELEKPPPAWAVERAIKVKSFSVFGKKNAGYLGNHDVVCCEKIVAHTEKNKGGYHARQNQKSG